VKRSRLRSSSPAFSRSVVVLGLALANVLLAGCASTATRAHTTTTPSAAPWEMPADAFGTQRLFQGVYSGPEGSGSFRATLRLAAADRFRLDAADKLGRALWSLGVEGEGGWFVDHRAGTWCADLSKLELPGLGGGPVSASALPALLLGALPVRPAEPMPDPSAPFEVRDGAGRVWSAKVEGGRLTAWTLAQGSEPVWWWRREGRGGVLSQRQGRQLRWEELVAEPLRGELPVRSIPAGYLESCEPRPAPAS
jgi:hypothetical protein